MPPPSGHSSALPPLPSHPSLMWGRKATRDQHVAVGGLLQEVPAVKLVPQEAAGSAGARGSLPATNPGRPGGASELPGAVCSILDSC